MPQFNHNDSTDLTRSPDHKTILSPLILTLPGTANLFWVSAHGVTLPLSLTRCLIMTLALTRCLIMTLALILNPGCAYQGAHGGAYPVTGRLIRRRKPGELAEDETGTSLLQSSES